MIKLIFNYANEQEHQNFVAQDENLGPILLSAKHELLANQDYVRLILRLRTGTMHEVVPATCLGEQASPHRMAKVTFSFIVIFFFFFSTRRRWVV